METDPATGLVIPTTARSAQPSPEHYHLVYNVPKDQISIPGYNQIYVTSKEAYAEVYAMGKAAEPNTEWYEEIGAIGIETRLRGRTDLWWIIVEVAACIRSGCLKGMERLEKKRQFVLLPDIDPDEP